MKSKQCTSAVLGIFFAGIPFCQQAQYFETAYGTTFSDLAGSIEICEDGFAIYGQTRFTDARDREATILKLDPNGTKMWGYTYGHSGTLWDDFAHGIQDDSKNHVAVGRWDEPLGNQWEQYAVKTDINGNWLWSRRYGSHFLDRANCVVEDDPAYVMVGEHGIGGPNFQQASILLLDKTTGVAYDANFVGLTGNETFISVDLDGTGGYITVGYTNSLTAGGTDFFLAHFTSSLNMDWAFSMGTPGNDEGLDVKTVPGGYICTGFVTSAAGDRDIAAYYWTSSGLYMWGHSYPMPGDQTGRSVRWNGTEYIIAATSDYMTLGSYDGMLLSIGPMGLYNWGKYYGGPDWDQFSDLNLASTGDIAATGYTRSAGAGNNDIWISYTDMAGVPASTCDWLEVTVDTVWRKVLTSWPKDNVHELIKQHDVFPDIKDIYNQTDICVGPAIKSPVSATEVKSRKSTLSPNPFTGEITLTLPTDAASIEVLDVHGRTVVRRELSGVNASVFDLSDQSNGVYLFRVTTSAGTEVHKAILAR